MMNLSLPKNIQIWGLTGGIGAGKTLAASFFREAGFCVINLDSLGHNILSTDSSLHPELRQIFGDSIFLEGVLKKVIIREIIFKDSKKREALENLLHPKIWKLFEGEVAEQAQQGATLFLCEAALLIEHHHATTFPRLIVVVADTHTRRHRVLMRDHMSPDLFDEILKIQTTDENRRALATHVLFNVGTQEALSKGVKKLVEKWKKDKVI